MNNGPQTINAQPLASQPIISLGDKNPFDIFAAWFAVAKTTEPNDPNAMALSTVDRAGRISSRMVLLKDFSKEGFVFYTNSQSDKGNALRDNPRAALLFHWKSLRQQIRIEGHITMVSTQEADDYFHSRPVDSQIGAWASAQSRPMATPDDLKNNLAKYKKQFADLLGGGKIPRPDYWLGYSLTPERFEFWQDQPNRLHDRLVFIKQGDGFRSEILFP
ncbi:MAG: pyridoxamine 5'-phosphate oxidase [Hydrotalea sp.]|nr:pyridoxamine 5'-phosphate oxidase [Hydrotalea sp.]